MKNIALMGAAVALALSSITAHAADKKTLVFVANGASDFWKAAEAGVKKANAELPNYVMQFKYPSQSSAAIQERLMDDLVAAGVSGIMVSAVDPKTETDALSKIAKQTLLLTTDSDAAKSGRVAYIGSSNVEAGKQVGEILKKAPSDGSVLGFIPTATVIGKLTIPSFPFDPQTDIDPAGPGADIPPGGGAMIGLEYRPPAAC